MARMIVYVSGLGGTPEASAPFLSRLVTEPGHEDDIVKVHPVPLRWNSKGGMQDRGAALAAQINAWDLVEKPDSIVLIGFSMGGLLVRYAYLFHSGSFMPEPSRPWAAKVKRIVLLGTPNSGFERRRLPLPMRLGLTAARLAPSLTVFDVEAGSAFLTDLRLRWVRHFQDDSVRHPPVVQLLGSDDNLVSRDDSLDIEAMPSSRHETVPNSRHSTVIQVDDPTFGAERYALLREAVFDEVIPTEPPGLLPEAEQSRPVVFVLHGIRSGRRGWVDELKTMLSSRTENPYVVAPSYGYFSALSFALPYRRVSNMRWFLNKYSSELVRRPHSTMSFVGHSNGTYILGTALHAVPSLQFDRIFLAGSVLPRTYDWSSRFNDHQVAQLRNDCASQDIPVLWLCSALRSLRQRDVGTAGVDGFDDLDERSTEYSYVHGGHAAALSDAHLPGIADFVMTGASSAPVDLVASPSFAFQFVGRLLQVVTAVVALGVVALLGWWIAAGPVASHAVIVGGVAAVLWVLLRTV
jgi:alpha-beta hydrolase superfamily lysophospholipase